MSSAARNNLAALAHLRLSLNISGPEFPASTERLTVPRQMALPRTALSSTTRKTPGSVSRPTRGRLLKILNTASAGVPEAQEVFVEFLEHDTYNQDFADKLINLARRPTAWNVRQVAVLMLENQTLKIDPEDWTPFDWLFLRLQLKRAPGLNSRLSRSVLKEGYSTTGLKQFIPQFRWRLQRLNRVHSRIDGWKTNEAALRDFITMARCDCKLSLSRYLFSVDDVVNQILSQLQVSEGRKDVDTTEPLYVEGEAKRGISQLPDFEASIIKQLCARSRVYWVSESTSAKINSLVEYPLTAVVLTIKLPGSDTEFEIKRAGLRGPQSLNVVCTRDGAGVPPSHRLDGGNMQWLLRHEIRSASKLSLIYRLVHDIEAPIPTYASRSTIYSIPKDRAAVQTLTYFTDEEVFGEGFSQMRQAMAECVVAFTDEGYAKLPDLPGDLGLTAQFLGLVSPTQAILNGTTSFRLDKLSAYLGPDGANRYFEQGLNTGYSNKDASGFADAILEEILGVYRPPDVMYRSFEQYLAAAFAVGDNHARADSVFQSILEQIGTFWGTLVGVRGYSRGESFVARNVGLKAYWQHGQWQVRIIFMDHDSLVIPGPEEHDFNARDALPCMMLDTTYLWGRPGAMLGSVGHLRSIYRPDDEFFDRCVVLARKAARKAYKKTQRQISTNPKLRRLFEQSFVERLADWDPLVNGYLRYKPETTALSGWKDKMRGMLVSKGYQALEIDACFETLDNWRGFLEKHSFLF